MIAKRLIQSLFLFVFVYLLAGCGPSDLSDAEFADLAVGTCDSLLLDHGRSCPAFTVTNFFRREI